MTDSLDFWHSGYRKGCTCERCELYRKRAREYGRTYRHPDPDERRKYKTEKQRKYDARDPEGRAARSRASYRRRRDKAIAGIIASGVKECTRCKEIKPFAEFEARSDARLGVSSRCRKCKNLARQERYNREIERERQRSQDYYRENRERIRERYRNLGDAERAERAERARARYRANPDVAWAKSLRQIHGIVPEEWYQMWEDQDGQCYLGDHPLPDERRKIAIDHDHSHCPPGKSCATCRRGLACSPCNTAIGLARDDPQMLRVIADSLERAHAAARQRIGMSRTGDSNRG